MGIGFTHAELIDEETFSTIDEAEFFDFCGERRYLDDLEGPVGKKGKQRGV